MIVMRDTSIISISGINSRVILNGYLCSRDDQGIRLGQGLAITEPQGALIGAIPGTIPTAYGVFNPDGTRATRVTIQRVNSSGNVPSRVATIPNSRSTHEHNYEWHESRAATEDADGEMIYVCTICGDVKYREATSAYNVFNAAVMEKIRKAAPGATVVVDTNKWISFHHMIMDMLAERPDVTLKINFLSEGHKGTPMTVTIPAGADYKSLVDKNGFTGFLFLGSKYGIALR